MNGKLEKIAGSLGGFQQSQFLKVDEGHKQLRGLFLLALHHVPHQKNNFAQFKFVWLVFVGMGEEKQVDGARFLKLFKRVETTNWFGIL